MVTKYIFASWASTRFGMKSLFVVAFLQVIAIASFAQTYSVTGNIYDAEDGLEIVAANITLSDKNSEQEYGTTTGFFGDFEFERVRSGTYELKVLYVGYQDYVQTVEVKEEAVALEDIQLKVGVELSEIKVTEKILPVIQKGDTTQMAADAYKTLPDASAEDLIEKMPTIVVEDGKVSAQGEEVKQVLVDGKEFFGEDPQAALRNLPAEIIDKIQIFDRQSEQAQFTGFDDGESSKTINIITKSNAKTGQFGKLYAGYGYPDKYTGGGNINIFNGDQRTSFIGMTNNLNQQNFSTQDLLGVVGSTGERTRRGPRGGGGGRGRGGRRGSTGTTTNDFLVGQQNGVTAVNAIGINFNDQLTKKLSISSSYFFNHTNNETEQTLSQQYFDSEGLTDLYLEDNLSNSTNMNHRFTANLNYKIDRRNSITFRPRLSVQTNNGEEFILGKNRFDNLLTSQTTNESRSKLMAINFDNALTLKHRFTKRGRTISANIRGGIAPKSGSNSFLAENQFLTPTFESDSINQEATLDNHNWNIATNLQYTEPIGKKSRLMFNYRTSYQQEDSDKFTYDYDQPTQAYSDLNDALSNVFSNDYVTHQLGGGYNYRVGELSFMTRASVQMANRANQQVFPTEKDATATFWSVLPSIRLRYKLSTNDNLMFSYRARTELPSLDQMQEVLDNSNPLQLRTGNADLGQAYMHQIFARYSKTSTEKSSVFFALLGGGYTNNYIGESTYLNALDFPNAGALNLETDAQITQPVNLDGAWNTRSMITYGFPVEPLKSKLNIDLNFNYSNNPSLINQELNRAGQATSGLGLTLASNISDRVDFTISSRSSYNLGTNTISSTSNNEYFNQNSRLKLNWIIWEGIIVRTDLTHQLYAGLSDEFNQNFLLWNLSIGKKIFKNDRGEISLIAFDLLGQNNSISRNVTETYIEDIQTNALEQYIMLHFKYDLRNFKLK